MRKSSLNKEVSTFYNSVILTELLGPLLLLKNYGSLYPGWGGGRKNFSLDAVSYKVNVLCLSFHALKIIVCVCGVLFAVFPFRQDITMK